MPDHIAGWKTPDDWREFRKRLIGAGNEAAWRTAFTDYFFARLNARYLEPINVLQENGTFRGEGFSIVTIQCSLIEFLQTTLQGKSYRFLRRNEILGPYEYASNKGIFVDFLTTREPFRHEFDVPLAIAFYENIRCGLLHEARTKGGWRIWARSQDGKVIDAQRNIIYRDNLQTAFKHFIEAYGGELPRNADLQAAFVRKFDALCVD